MIAALVSPPPQIQVWDREPRCPEINTTETCEAFSASKPASLVARAVQFECHAVVPLRVRHLEQSICGTAPAM